MASESAVAAPTAGEQAARWGDRLAALPLADLLASVVATSGSVRPVVAPATGSVIAELPLSTTEDVVHAVRLAREAQVVWSRTPVRERAAVLLRVHDDLLRCQGEVLDLVQFETGKARGHAFEEVAHVAMVARWNARRGPALLAETPHGGLVPVLSRVREVHQPHGVVGIIAPWNYPLTLGIGDALPALLAGNGVVIKPDPRTTLTATWAVRLLTRAGVPEGLVQVVAGDGPDIGAGLVDAADYVCFTGSTAAGRQVAARAAQRLVGCSLELGGKNVLYVAEDADLDRAAEGAVRDCFGNAGQLCVSTERLLVHADVADDFLDRFLDRVRHLRLGWGLDWDAELGCLISLEHLARVAAHVDDAVAHGARVLAGGRARPDLGPAFYEPTVLDHVPPQALCHDQETFGPVVTMRQVRDDDHAVTVANDTEYGLTTSIWTRDLHRGGVLARRIRTGSVAINETYASVFGSVATPMGGMKSSGLGRRHGAAGLLRFTEAQSVLTQHVVGTGPLFALGASTVAEVLTRALRSSRAARLPWP
jgi:succinate-semialdehyde dehydrogenase/glutarate-semialdehyde dehydrogenase